MINKMILGSLRAALVLGILLPSAATARGFFRDLPASGGAPVARPVEARSLAAVAWEYLITLFGGSDGKEEVPPPGPNGIFEGDYSPGIDPDGNR